MNSTVLRSLQRTCPFDLYLPLSSVRRYASKRPSSTFDEADFSAARKWLAALNPDTIPQNICEMTFSRSSGPGGQKVNK